MDFAAIKGAYVLRTYNSANAPALQPVITIQGLNVPRRNRRCYANRLSRIPLMAL
jgi:hypothetical protein